MLHQDHTCRFSCSNPYGNAQISDRAFFNFWKSRGGGGGVGLLEGRCLFDRGGCCIVERMTINTLIYQYCISNKNVPEN